jgi:hypothetical protein
VTIPDCGHSMMAEAPDTVLDTLREFLSAKAALTGAQAPAQRGSSH